MKKFILFTLLSVCLIVTACKKNNDLSKALTNEEQATDSFHRETKQLEKTADSAAERTVNSTDGSSVNSAAERKPANSVDDVTENPAGNLQDKADTKSEEIWKDTDFRKSFQNINGCAIFYHEKENRYDVYQSKFTTERLSPYSTFKIISTLMGLDQGIVTSGNSRMGYNGKKYWNEDWNKDLTLKEAFQVSCIWYFEKVVDGLEKDYVQKVLDELHYGNCDLSAWTKAGHNDFWLDSSLAISPKEQIQVLVRIFSQNKVFDEEHINLLKEIMLVESNDSSKIYGKTGSAKDTYGWFAGFFEKQGDKVYFAVQVREDSLELCGPKAKEITLDIIKRYYK